LLPRILTFVAHGFGVEARAADLTLSFFRGEIAFCDLKVEKRLAPGGPPETVFEAPSGAVSIDLLALFCGEIRLVSIAARGARLRIEIGPDGRSTLRRIVDEAPWLRGAGDAGGRLAVERVALEGLAIEFQDLSSDVSLYIGAALDVSFDSPPREGDSEDPGARVLVRGTIDGLARDFAATARVHASHGGAIEIEASARGEGLSLLFLNPYLSPKVAAELEDGRLEVAGRARLAPAASGVALAVDLDRLRIEDGARTLVSAAALSLRLPRFDAPARTLVVGRAAVRGLRFEARRDEAGVLHGAGFALAEPSLLARFRRELPAALRDTYRRLAALRGARGAATAAFPPEPVFPTVVIEDIICEDIAIAWSDRAVLPPLETILRLRRAKLEGLSFPELPRTARYEAQLSIDGILDSLSISGRLDPFGNRRTLALAARLEGLALDRLAPYAAGAGAVLEGKNLRLEIEARAEVADLGPGRYAIDASLGETTLYDGTAVLAGIGSARLRMPLFDLASRRAEIAEIDLADPVIRARRRPDGRLEALAVSFAPKRRAGAGEPPGPPWSAALDLLHVAGLWVEIRNEGGAVPFTSLVDVRDVRLSGLSLPGLDRPFSLSIDGGVLTGLDRLFLEARLGREGPERTLDIRASLEGFRPEKLAPDFLRALADLREVAAETRLFVRFEEPEPGVFRGRASAGRTEVRERGTRIASLEGLEVEARCVAPGEDVWDFLRVTAIAPDLRVERLEDGRLRLIGWTSEGSFDLFRKSGGGSAGGGGREPREAARVPEVSIAKLDVHRGRAGIRDRAVSPPGVIELESIEVEARNIETRPGLRACGPDPSRGNGGEAGLTTFSVRTSAPDLASELRASGRLSLSPRASGDLAFHAQGVRLPALTPWGQAAARIAFLRGEGDLDVLLGLWPGRFESRWWIALRDLELGGEGASEKIEGGSGPVSLATAVALLRDEEGKIDLELKIDGERGARSADTARLVGSSIAQALSSSLRKIISPLTRLLKHVFGPREFPPVFFPPGEARLSEEAVEALERAAGRLDGARVEVRGAADPATDLTPVLFFRSVMDAIDLGEEGVPPVLARFAGRGLAALEAEAARARRLDRLAREEEARAARREARARLRELALERAQAVKSYLALRGVAEERLLLGEPRAGAILPFAPAANPDNARAVEIRLAPR
jgi:hypothetical protein